MNRTFGSSLVLRLCLLIMLSLAVFAYAGYRMVLAPAIKELARVEMSGASQRVQNKVENYFSEVETSLRTSAMWAINTQTKPTADSLAKFTSVFIPVLQNQAGTLDIVFSDEAGRFIRLSRSTEGLITTLLGDPVVLGQNLDFSTWSPQGQLLTREVREVEADSRARQWFRDAMSQSSTTGLFWADPLENFPGKEPVISGVFHWMGADGKRYIMAHTVALEQLSEFTSHVTIAQHGIASLLDDKGRILAVPRQGDPGPNTGPMSEILRSVDDSEVSVLKAGYAQWRAQDNATSVIIDFNHDGARWFGMFQPTETAGQIAWLASFAPANEFLPMESRVLFSLLAITLLAIGIACWIGLRVARRVAKPLEILTLESERIGRLELDAPVSDDRSFSAWTEMRQLGTALNTMRQRLLDTKETLEDSRQKLELRVADRTQALAGQVVFIEALLDTIPNAIFYKGADTRFIGCNRAYETLFGVSRSQFIGKTVLDLEYLPLAMRQAYQQEDARVVQECSRVSRSEDLVFADGLVHNTLYTVTGFANPDGTPAGLIGVIVDVTELKSAEQVAVKASLAARAATDAKAMFLANMSHEIRTPMNAILGLTHLVLQMELPQRQRSHLEKVNSAAQGLLLLINDILDFSKIEAGKMTCENAEFSLDLVISHLVDVLSMRARDKGLELLFDIENDVPDRLMGDAVRLGQVLTNLFSNAVKFTEHGEITLNISCVTKSLDHTVLLFAVHDTGVGMNEVEIAKVFSAFTQADSSTTRRFGGTGLGLSICKHIVELMGGSIHVESEPGRGSVFSFEASFGAVLQSDLVEPAPTTQNLVGMRTLIVDDNAAARLVFEHILQGHGLTTHTAGHGEDALAELVRAKAAGQPYRVLILDWKMARLDGIQTLRQVQSVLGVDAPQCIMATAYDPDSLQEELGPTRVAAIVQKPVTGKQLLEAIHTALQTDSAPIERSGPTSGSANLAELSRLLSGTHVLLVEDNVTNQELAMELLAAVGTTADIANDGVEALSMLEHTTYALVLMDCQMPVMDGFEATRRLRAQARFADLPVIAMTANAMAGERERCLSAGMSDYLSKPIDLGLLYSKLVHWAPRAGRSAALAMPEVATTATGQPSVAGTVLDEAGGLTRTNANHALYERLLRKFSQREADASAHLDAALRAGDRDTALRNIHNLKGIAATIGGHALSAACLTLENELRKPSQAPQSVILAKQAWQTELDRLLAYLQQRPVRSDESGSDNPLPSGLALVPPGVAAQCAELRSLLVSSDARANRLAESLAETLRATELEQQARLIARHAARFDYDDALTSLQALQESLD